MKKTYSAFLDESKYLIECKEYLTRGISIPKTIHGRTLTEYLVIDTDRTNVSTVSTQTDIEIEPRHKASQNEQQNYHPTVNSVELVGRKDDQMGEMAMSDVPFDSDEGKSTPNRKRILVGKNVEKLPQ